MKLLILLLLVSQAILAQEDLNFSDNDTADYLLKDDYFNFELVKIEKSIYCSIDSIVTFNSTPSKNIYWYVEFYQKGDTTEFVLTKDHLEKIVLINSKKGLCNKVFMINNGCSLIMRCKTD